MAIVVGWVLWGFALLLGLGSLASANSDGGVRFMMRAMGLVLLAACAATAFLPISKLWLLAAFPVAFLVPCFVMYVWASVVTSLIIKSHLIFRGPAKVNATNRNASMTVSEAYYVAFDIVASELAGGCKGHLYHPVSALKGYDIIEICIAFKLVVANAFLLYADRDAFDETTGEKKFRELLEWCDSGAFHVVGPSFVPDDQIDLLVAKPAFEFDDPLFLSQETPSSLAEYCRLLGADDPLYWQKVYERLELEYTSASPRGNDALPPVCDLDDSGIRDHFMGIVSAFSDVEANIRAHIGDCGNLPYPKKTILYAIRWLMDHCEKKCEVTDDRAFIDHYDKLNSSLSWLFTRVARDWHQIEPTDKDAIAKLNQCESFSDWALPLKAKYIDEDAASNEAFDVAFEVTKDRVAFEKRAAGN
jgi:hypothetical protein